MSTAEPLPDLAPTPAPGTARRGHIPAVIITLIAGSQLMVTLDATVVNVSLPKIQAALHFSAVSLAWVPAGYTLAAGGLLLLGGRTGDILGRRRTFMTGLTVFTLASLLAGLANGEAWLLTARVLQGAGAAFTAPSALALISTNFTPGPLRTRAIALYAAVTGAGGALGMVIGGMITTWASWPWVFFINLPIGAAIVALTPLFIDESERHRQRVDVAGALVGTVGVTALVYGFIRAASSGWHDSYAIGALVAAVVLLAVFITTELRVGDPILPLFLYSDRNRIGAYLVTLLMTGSSLGLLFYQSQFLQEVLNFTPLKAGLAFLPMSAVLLLTTVFTARLLPKFGPRPIIGVGALITTGATLWFSRAVTTHAAYAPDLLGPLLLTGLGLGLMFGPLTTLALAGIPKEKSAIGSSLLNVTNQIGGTIGLAVLVTVFGTASRNEARHPVGGTARQQAADILSHGIQSAFMVAAIFLALAFVLCVVIINAKGSAFSRTPAPAGGEPAKENDHA